MEGWVLLVDLMSLEVEALILLIQDLVPSEQVCCAKTYRQT